MDWTSRRITAILENALREDSATRDATTYACIDPQQRATGTILAKEDCVLAGLGIVARILDVFAELDGTILARRPSRSRCGRSKNSRPRSRPAPRPCCSTT